MNSRRFIPCAAFVLGMLGLGGKALAEEPDAVTGVIVAGFYILAGLIVIVLSKRIAAWWRSSILLPFGCAALLMLAGINGLSRLKWNQSPAIYTNTSTPAPQTSARGVNL